MFSKYRKSSTGTLTKQRGRKRSADKNRWEHRGRKLLMEQFERRIVLDATLHAIAAANIDVVQHDGANNTTSVTVTAPYAFNDFQIREGSNRGDFNVQIGAAATDDPANGIIISSVRQNGRNNTPFGEPAATSGLRYATVAIQGAAAGYYLPVFDSPSGNEFNINLASAYFTYSDWYAGWGSNTTNGGELTNFAGNASLTLGTHLIDNADGTYTVDLRPFGIDSRTDGVLVVNGGKNEDNYSLARAIDDGTDADGTWLIYNKDNGADASAYERDGVAFAYVPLAEKTVVSGKFLGDGTNALESRPFHVEHTGTGSYRLTIPGYTPADGVLIISAEGGAGLNVDNVVSYQADGIGWLIQTRDIAGMGLQNIEAANAVASFVFIPGPEDAGITVAPTAGLLTTEGGESDAVAIVLDRQPSGDVTIPISSSNTAEGVVDKSELVFTQDNWYVPQIVTVTGVDDALADGSQAYSIITGAATSADADYDGIDPADVSVINLDDEAAGVTLDGIIDLVTTETGGEVAFSIFLNKQPAADVIVEMTSSNPSEGAVNVASVTFTAENWNSPQMVTVTGQDDQVDDGDVAYVIEFSVGSLDPDYDAFPVDDVNVTNVDNDTAGFSVNPITGLVVTETGVTADLTVVLNSQPIADVVVAISSSDTSEGTVSAPSLTFTLADWNVPQVITVTGVDDLAGDGDIDFTILTTVTAGDELYELIDPDDVAVMNLDSEPQIVLGAAEVGYGIGDPAFTIDSLGVVTDLDNSDYDTGNMTITLVNGTSDDRVAIRNQGSDAGQIGVTGGFVTYGGTTIGVFAGGSGANPLVITFNAEATPVATQALLRNITFQNESDTPVLAPRIVEFVVEDGDGGTSNVATKIINMVVIRSTKYQQGVDHGYGTYAGAHDVQLDQSFPDTVEPIGQDANGLLVDWPDAGGSNEDQVLLRFDDLFGDQPGQIPYGAKIVAATLTVDSNNQGDGARMYRMLLPWDSQADTWNSFGSDSDGRNATPGVQADGLEARIAYDSQVGTVDGGGDTGTGVTEIGVTKDLQAWADGDTNHGWFLGGFELLTDGWAFSPSEASNPNDRPLLTVEWIPGDIEIASFQQSDEFGEYQSAYDTVLLQADPGTPQEFAVGMFVDAPDAGNENQVLMWFDNIIGNGNGQIPVGSQVHSAQLVLASTINNAQGDGGSFHAMLKPWYTWEATWDSFVDGIQTDGIEAAATYNAQAGVPARYPNVQAGFNSFDVTVDVQAWVSQTLPNYGWAFLPWANGTDGWGIASSDAVQNERPELRVFFTPPGITVNPTSELVTSEAGGTAEFSIVLDTKPLADVTITVASDDETEGVAAPGTLTFTADNWNIPQIVTVAGVDDLDPDGAVAYSILSTAVSDYAAYDGMSIESVSVTNVDNDTAGVSVVPSKGLVTSEGGAQAVFTVVLNTQPTADVTIGLTSSDPGEGTPSPASLTFTVADWSTPQVVTVTGVDDFFIDGSVNYTIVTGAPSSTDPEYDALTANDVADVLLTNEDNDVAGITVSPTSGLVTTEDGGSDTFTVVLNTVPTSNVIIDILSSNTVEGIASPASLTFTSANWNVPRVVTVTGQDDGDVNDDNVLYTIALTTNFFTMDADYRSLNPDDVTVTNIDNDNVPPLVTLPGGDARYAIGTSGVGIDGGAIVSDTDPTNFDTATLTVTLAANGTVDDRLGIRNDGTSAGQVGIDGGNVTFGGVVVGTFAGGTHVDPLVITFNAEATPQTAQAVLRAVMFYNESSTPDTTPRTVEVVVVDNGGLASSIASKTVQLSLIQVASYQNGIDAGYGVYGGTADIQLAQFAPDTPLPVGGDGNGLLVDYDGGLVNSQVLMRFDSLIGTGPGQIPVGAQILSATLILDTNNTGDGGTLHRMLTSWDAETETWNTFANGVDPRNTQGGVQKDDAEAKSAYESQAHDASGTGATGTGPVFFGVTDDIQAWANGEDNHGWAMIGWNGNTDGWAFSPSEAANPLDRPQLYVQWIPGDVSSASFRQGVNGYTGTVDTYLLQNQPNTDHSNTTRLWSDAADNNNENQILLRFEDIIGNGLAQIPPGAVIHAAVLDLASIGSNATGDGGSFNTMLTSWSDTDTWNSLGGGVQADDVEAASTYNAAAGNDTRAPNVPYGFNSFDVTADLQAWIGGSLDNNGWAILPWVGGTDGWAMHSSEIAVEQERPTLRVYFSAGPGVVIDPTTNVSVSEDGATAALDVMLSAEPTADVTLTVTADAEMEVSIDGGATYASSADLIFSPGSATTPQTITVRALDDAELEGAHTGTLSFSASSADADYDGATIGDVTVDIADNETLKVDQIVINDGSSQRSKVTHIRVSFNADVDVQDGAFIVRNLDTGEIVTLDVNVLGSIVTLSFLDGASVVVGDASRSLTDGNYELTIDDAKVTALGTLLDGDDDGSAGGDYVFGALKPPRRISSSGSLAIPMVTVTSTVVTCERSGLPTGCSAVIRHTCGSSTNWVTTMSTRVTCAACDVSLANTWICHSSRQGTVVSQSRTRTRIRIDLVHSYIG